MTGPRMDKREEGFPWRAPLPFWLGGLLLLALGVAHVQLRLEVQELRFRDELRRGLDASEPPLATDGGVSPVESIATGDGVIPTPRSSVGRGQIDPATCHGDLTEEQVRSVVAARGQRVFACRDRSTTEGPATQAVLDAEVLVDPSGSVDSIRHSGLSQGPLLQCAIQEMLAWRFPPPSEGCAIVRIPFLFRPDNAPTDNE